MSRFAGTRPDLHDAVGDLGHFELEQPFDQPRMGPADHDLGTLGRVANLDDVGLDPGVGVWALVGDLFSLRQQSLDLPEIQQRVTRVGLLDHPGDDVALTPRILLVLQLALGLANPLSDDLACGLRGDAPEIVGCDLELLAHGFAFFIEVLGEDPEVHGLGVDRDPRILVGAWYPLVGGLQRVGQCRKQCVNGNPALGGERLESFHHI